MNYFMYLIVAVIIISGFVLLKMMSRRRSLKGPTLLLIRNAWRHAESQPNSVLKIVEADKVLHEALRLLGYAGSLGQKLKTAGPRFSNINEVWSAHKLRNKLVHELNPNLTESEANRIFKIFERALLDLGFSKDH